MIRHRCSNGHNSEMKRWSVRTHKGRPQTQRRSKPSQCNRYQEIWQFILLNDPTISNQQYGDATVTSSFSYPFLLSPVLLSHLCFCSLNPFFFPPSIFLCLPLLGILSCHPLIRQYKHWLPSVRRCVWVCVFVTGRGICRQMRISFEWHFITSTVKPPQMLPHAFSCVHILAPTQDRIQYVQHAVLNPPKSRSCSGFDFLQVAWNTQTWTNLLPH